MYLVGKILKLFKNSSEFKTYGRPHHYQILNLTVQNVVDVICSKLCLTCNANTPNPVGRLSRKWEEQSLNKGQQSMLT